jgi:hypothetical protein
VSSNHDLSALLLVALAFGGFIVAAGTTTPNVTILINQPENNQANKSENMKTGLYYNSYDYSEISAADLAATFSMSQSAWVDWADSWYDAYTTKVNAVHVLNPNYKFLLYRNCMSIPNFDATDWAYANSQGWLLKDASNNYVTESYVSLYMVDITNPAYQVWVAAKVAAWLIAHPEFDGVMADNSIKYSAQEFDNAGSTRPINPSTATYFTNSEIIDGCADILNAIIDAIGTSKLLMPNGIWNGAIWANDWYGGDNYRAVLAQVPRLNCLSSEGTFMPTGDAWYTAAEWKASLDFAVWVQTDFLIADINRIFSGGASTSTIPSGATLAQVLTFGYCSMMLAVNYSVTQNNLSFSLNETNLMSSGALPFLEALQTIDLGAATGAYYLSQNVYMRDFADGKIIVNPSTNNYNIVLAGYKFLFGGLDADNFAVNAHSATILIPDATSIVYPSTALSLNYASVMIDTPVVCTATYTGDVGVPTGTATFYVSPDNGVSWIQIGLATALVAGVASSINYYPSLVGTYLFKAVYSGDANYSVTSVNTSLLVSAYSVVASPPVMLGLLGAIITKMEAANVGDSYWDRGIWEDGMWEHDTPMIKLRKQMEKQ